MARDSLRPPGFISGERGESFGDLHPRAVIEGWLVVQNAEGKPGVIPPKGADPADCPSAAIVAMLEIQKETDIMNEPMLQFFRYEHLKPDLAAISKPFSDLAHQLVRDLPRNPERTVALRKLLEAKDCAVRAFIYKTPE